MAGVGGPTIELAKRNMKVSELATWAAYRKKRGSFNASLRIEEGFARVQAAIYSIMSKEPVDASQFMPYVVGRQAEDAPPDATEVVNLLKGLAVKSDVSNKYLERRAARRQSIRPA